MNYFTIQRNSDGAFFSTKDRFHKSEPPRLYNRQSDAENSLRAYCRRTSTHPARFRMGFRIVPVQMTVTVEAVQLMLNLVRTPIMNRLKK